MWWSAVCDCGIPGHTHLLFSLDSRSSYWNHIKRYPAVLWLLVFYVSFSWCLVLVCSVWLWYFLVTLTYFFMDSSSSYWNHIKRYPAVLWLWVFYVSFSRRHVMVCSVWLCYFLVTLTYFFPWTQDLLLVPYRAISCCIVAVSVLLLFLTVPCDGLQCVIVVFPGHTHPLFSMDSRSSYWYHIKRYSAVLWLLVFYVSFSRCHVMVCSVWLWYFLVTLTYFFPWTQDLAIGII